MEKANGHFNASGADVINLEAEPQHAGRDVETLSEPYDASIWDGMDLHGNDFHDDDADVLHDASDCSQNDFGFSESLQWVRFA